MVNYFSPSRLLDRSLSEPCAFCGNAAHRGICQPCRNELCWIEHACTQCGIPLPQTGLCAFCQIKPPPFTRCISPLTYEAPISHLIGAFKYQRQLHYGRILSGLLVERLCAGTMLATDVIVPTPLHWRRRWSRGFNQAEIIGDEISRALALPMRARWLRRTRATPRQQDLNAAQRRKNLHDAFTVTRALDGLHVAVVDDVVTTGATVSEISRVLLAAGAASVQIWCLAHTP